MADQSVIATSWAAAPVVLDTHDMLAGGQRVEDSWKLWKSVKLVYGHIGRRRGRGRGLRGGTGGRTTGCSIPFMMCGCRSALGIPAHDRYGAGLERRGAGWRLSPGVKGVG